MSATGPSWATRIALAASKRMEAKSTSLLTLDEEANTLTGEAELNVTMALPVWVPVPVESVRRGGQGSMDKQVEGDLRGTVENLAAFTN